MRSKTLERSPGKENCACDRVRTRDFRLEGEELDHCAMAPLIKFAGDLYFTRSK